MKPVLKAFLLLLGLAIVAGAIGIWYFVNSGVSAKEQPGRVEEFMARNVRNMAIARRAKALTNPIEYSAEVIADGRAHFADHCATCHANDGSGKTALGQGLWPKAPDMRQAATQNLTDGELFYIIHNGIRLTGMPAFGQSAPDQDMDSWKLVHFIRQLPSLTDDELATMKAMNPKSRHELEEEEAARRFLAGEDLPSDKHGHHD